MIRVALRDLFLSLWHELVPNTNDCSNTEYYVRMIVDVGGLCLGTLAICNPRVQSEWIMVAWLVSLLCTLRLLAASRGNLNRQSWALPFVVRVTFAGVSVFILVFASAIFAAYLHAPKPLH